MCTYIIYLSNSSCIVYTYIYGRDFTKSIEKKSTWWISKLKTTCILSGWQTPGTSDFCSSPPASKPGRPQLKQISFWSLVLFAFLFAVIYILSVTWNSTLNGYERLFASLELPHFWAPRYLKRFNDSCDHTINANNWWHFRYSTWDEKNPCCLPGELPPEMIFYNLMGKDRRRTSAGKKNAPGLLLSLRKHVT